MKTLKIYKPILLIIALVAFNSCVEDDDFDVPDTTTVEPVFGPNQSVIQISSIAGDLAQEQGGGDLDYTDDETLYPFPTEGNELFVEGYVISSDEGGNFFEELVLQNSAENPNLGVRVLIDVNPLYIRYEVGRKVFVKLNGLVAGISNGVLTVGPQDGDRIGKISLNSETEYIVRSAEVATIVPLALSISDFADDKPEIVAVFWIDSHTFDM